MSLKTIGVGVSPKRQGKRVAVPIRFYPFVIADNGNFIDLLIILHEDMVVRVSLESLAGESDRRRRPSFPSCRRSFH